MKKVQSSCAKRFQVKKASSSDEPKTSCFADVGKGRWESEGRGPRWVNKERGRKGNKNRGPTSPRIITF